jgi:23S rRNA pseudouridine1911/1915/1917 synthase
MNIDILYEDNNLIVINKPAGIAVHPDLKSKEKTISDWFLEKYPKAKNVGEPMEIETKGGKKIKIIRPGIVHRLDKETSGALIIVKNQKTFKFIKDQFIKHQIQKVYQAFVYGFVSNPKASLFTNKRGLISSPIGRSANDIGKWTAGRGARLPLREAKTEYIILKKFKDKAKSNKVGSFDVFKETFRDEDFSFLEIYPQTGRTHQIRVHLRYLNHPIVSDPLYRGKKDLALGLKRLALHAKSITFQLPNGENKIIEASYPVDFKKAIDQYIK